MNDSQETVDMVQTTRGSAFSLVGITLLILGGCGVSSSPVVSTPASASSTSSALSISGNPALFVEIGKTYDFRPIVSNASAAALTFSIQNKPSWALFDPATGALSGTPTAANSGNTGSIVISVSDGATISALEPFFVDVVQGTTAGTASLSWVSPPANSTGTLEVEGYHIYFGSSAQNLTRVVDVGSPNATSFVMSDLPAGTWYFGIASYNAAKIESSLSAIVNVSI